LTRKSGFPAYYGIAEVTKKFAPLQGTTYYIFIFFWVGLLGSLRKGYWQCALGFGSSHWGGESVRVQIAKIEKKLPGCKSKDSVFWRGLYFSVVVF